MKQLIDFSRHRGRVARVHLRQLIYVLHVLCHAAKNSLTDSVFLRQIGIKTHQSHPAVIISAAAESFLEPRIGRDALSPMRTVYCRLNAFQ